MTGGHPKIIMDSSPDSGCRYGRVEGKETVIDRVRDFGEFLSWISVDFTCNVTERMRVKFSVGTRLEIVLVISAFVIASKDIPNCPFGAVTDSGDFTMADAISD
jgi:hypothetical protein